MLLALDDKRIMDCPRLDNIYVYPVEGNQKEIMQFNIFLIVMSIAYISLGFWLGWF